MKVQERIQVQKDIMYRITGDSSSLLYLIFEMLKCLQVLHVSAFTLNKLLHYMLSMRTRTWLFIISAISGSWFRTQ